ncbi:MAG: ABC transporter permease [Bacillota bacterium]|nr:ABC transporter permease [Bacillota bacterium]
MNNILVLTKILLKTGKGNNNDSKSNVKKIILYIFLAICFLPIVFMVVSFTASAAFALSKIHQEALVLALGLAVSCVIIGFFGIFYVMSTYYFSQDVEQLLPLPLRPYEILLSKFMVVLVYELLTDIFFLAPLLITYGIVIKMGAVYYLYAVIIYFTLPIIPLIIDSLVIMIIMRFTNLGKHKDILKVVAGALGIAFGVGMQIVGNIAGRNAVNSNMSMDEILRKTNSLADSVTKIYPSSKIVVNSLINSNNIQGIYNMVLYIGITVLLIYIMRFIGEEFYFKGVIGINQSSSSRKKVSEKEIKASTIQNSSLKSYVLKELKLIIRTPAYFLNCVLINLIMPLFFIGPFLSSRDKISKSINMGNLIANPKMSSIVLTAAFAFIVFISAMNPAACTSISREGKNLFTTKYMPISYKTQILGKILSAVILNVLGIVILLVAAVGVANVPILECILILITGILGIFFNAFIGIFIDLNYPKLQWDDEQRAVKQNLNVFISMIIGMAAGGFTAVPLIILSQNLWFAFSILMVVYGVIDILLYILVSKAGVKAFEKLEG